MKEIKDSNEDKLLYKTIDKLEKRDKSRFWFNVLIISSIVLAITTVLSLGYTLNQQRELEAQKLRTEKLEAELQKQEAEQELEKMAVEVVEALANREATVFEDPSPIQQIALEQSLERVAKRADVIISKTRQGRSFKDTLFVWSHTGLNIRSAPVNGVNVIWGFPFGTPVENLSGGRFESKQISIPTDFGGRNFSLTGGYLKVEHDTVSGYGYSGLLSPLPVFISAKSIEEYVKLASTNSFLMNEYGLKVRARGKKEVTLLTKNLTIQEVFLLVRNLYSIDQKVKGGKRVSNLAQSDDKWSVTVGDLSVTVEKVREGVVARVVTR